MYVCWVLAQKRESQRPGIHNDKRKKYTLHDILDSVEPAGHAGSDAILHSAYSKGNPGIYKWHTAFTEGKGPKISRENGNKYFPYIKVSSSGKMFKVKMTLWCVRICCILILLTFPTFPLFWSAPLQLRNELGGSTYAPDSS
jgi:hypothetical protein